MTRDVRASVVEARRPPRARAARHRRRRGAAHVVFNRVMVVELGLPATVPSTLVAMHFAVQMLRAPMGHASDLGGRRRWIFGGAVGLAAGATLAAFGLSVAVADRAPGLALAAVGVKR